MKTFLKDYFTSGEFAILAGCSSKGCNKWTDQCIAQIKALEEDGQRQALEKLFLQDPQRFEQKIKVFTVKDEKLKPLTIAVLKGCPLPYRVSDDRRIPRETMIGYLREAGNEQGLRKLGITTAGMKGVLFASAIHPDYMDKVVARLDQATYSCVNTPTGVDTCVMIEQMHRQNGGYPTVIADDSLGNAELKALGMQYGRKCAIIAVIGPEQTPNDFSDKGFATVIKNTDGINSPQIDRMLKWIESQDTALNGKRIHMIR